MIIKITLILVSLVALNFLLLFFSCNKTTKKPKPVKTEKLPPATSSKSVASQLPENHLAPTGS